MWRIFKRRRKTHKVGDGGKRLKDYRKSLAKLEQRRWELYVAMCANYDEPLNEGVFESIFYNVEEALGKYYACQRKWAEAYFKGEVADNGGE
ncbi:MAG: hypothetical protein LUC22_07340 [Prevotella sp.]|nr:hypothetical protein [Prevotella sp.]